MAVLSGRAGRAAVALAALAAVALGLRATVLAPDGETGSPDGTALAATDTTFDPACPGRGHKDPGVSGFADRERRRLLPGDYSFTFLSQDGCRPARMNPCQPIHYVVNPALAPPDGVVDVAEAFARLGAAMGITFVDDGVTDETYSERRDAYQPDRYGERWAPILVVWAKLGAGRGDIQVVGRGRPFVRDGVVVSGMLTLNVDAVTDEQRGTPLRGGFGPAGGFNGIGPEGVTWGRVILHELAHIANLGHVGSRSELMYPETAEQTARTAQFGRGDLAGLRLLGREGGCADTPTPSPSPPTTAHATSTTGVRPPG